MRIKDRGEVAQTAQARREAPATKVNLFFFSKIANLQFNLVPPVDCRTVPIFGTLVHLWPDTRFNLVLLVNPKSLIGCTRDNPILSSGRLISDLGS